MCDKTILAKAAWLLLTSQGFIANYRDSPSTFGINRRNVINQTLNASLEPMSVDVDCREQLRRYFDTLWDLPAAQYKSAHADLTDSPTIFFEDFTDIPNRFDAVDDLFLNSINSKETTVKNSLPTPITVTTQVLINGVLASNYSDPELFQSIAAQEAAIKELEGIQTKPASLVDEIDARKAGISALVTYLDSRPKK